MNVSREADAQFMRELKHSDRRRYDLLITAMQRGQYAAIRLAERTESSQRAEQPQLPKAA